MALKDLYKMTKADRYTADGREALIKAQEAETEDKVYQIGEISQKTGLQKTANGWVKPPRNKEIQNAGKHAESVKAAQKAKKEEARRQQRAEGEANARAFQEKVEKGEIKPAAPVKRNEAETVKHSDGTESYRIKGTQFYFNTPEEAESAILAKNRGGTTYARPSQDPTVNNIQESLGFKLDTSYGGKHSMDDFMKKTGENEYAVNVWSFGTDSKGTLISPLSETDKPDATIKKENGEWKLHYKDRDGKETVVTANGRQDPTESKPTESKPDTMQEMRNAERPIKTAAQIITRGDLDDAIINSARDEEALQDIARDLLSPAFDAIGEDIPDNYMEFATDLIKNRYEVLEERATGDAAPRVLTGDCKIRVKK